MEVAPKGAVVAPLQAAAGWSPDEGPAAGIGGCRV